MNMTDRSNMAWYVCGPMSGLPRFNYPLFHLVACYLRDKVEQEVISPTELDSKKMQALAWASKDGNLAAMEAGSGETWGDVLARDVRLIEKKIGHFALLPGWEKSRGARLEVFVGLLVGVTDFYTVYFDENGRVMTYLQSLSVIRDEIRRNMP
jgi:Domain of unknown function (DUF4406)